MHRQLFFFEYVVWHYTTAFRDFISLWLNFAWFVTHLFSMSLLFRTFFSPWKRMDDTYERGSIESIAETFVFNTFSRILGMCVRTVLLIVGSAVLVVLCVALVLGLIIWTFLPLLAALCFFYGVILINL